MDSKGRKQQWQEERRWPIKFPTGGECGLKNSQRWIRPMHIPPVGVYLGGRSDCRKEHSARLHMLPWFTRIRQITVKFSFSCYILQGFCSRMVPHSCCDRFSCYVFRCYYRCSRSDCRRKERSDRLHMLPWFTRIRPITAKFSLSCYVFSCYYICSRLVPYRLRHLRTGRVEGEGPLAIFAGCAREDSSAVPDWMSFPLSISLWSLSLSILGERFGANGSWLIRHHLAVCPFVG